MSRTIYTAALLAGAAALALAGCGGSGNSSGGSGTGEAKATVPPVDGAMVLTVASVPKLGGVLVDSRGFTAYDFDRDRGTTSSCYGACARAWPPITTKGAPLAGEGAVASKLGTTKRKNGTVQVTYAGHPLYTFTEDKKPGEANGNEVSAFGSQWHALDGDGQKAGG